MSGIPDDAFDEFFDYVPIDPPKRKYNKDLMRGVGPNQWKTIDGDVLEMREMYTSHLMNSLRMCERYGYSTKLMELTREIQRRSLEGEPP